MFALNPYTESADARTAFLQAFMRSSRYNVAANKSSHSRSRGKPITKKHHIHTKARRQRNKVLSRSLPSAFYKFKDAGVDAGKAALVAPKAPLNAFDGLSAEELWQMVQKNKLQWHHSSGYRILIGGIVNDASSEINLVPPYCQCAKGYLQVTNPVEEETDKIFQMYINIDDEIPREEPSVPILMA